MTQFSVHPTIQLCDTCQELANTYDLGPQDLLFTNDFLFDPYFAPLNLKCPVLFQEKYGLGEPTDEMVEAIYRDMPKDITRIVAVGGGTVLDVAKILSLKHVSPILDLYDGKLPIEKGKELILVPTTCGTGTEVTNISILSLVSRRTKKGLANDAMYADQAVMIPELLGGLPFRFFATSSIDALIHAIESAQNDKRVYAAMRMRRIMCEGEAASIPRLGYAEDVAAITPEALTAHWRTVLRTAPVCPCWATSCWPATSPASPSETPAVPPSTPWPTLWALSITSPTASPTMPSSPA